ncbi:type IV secretory system conjugative DNA transfer family protein [Bailinhaonella thermotolerans]|uniref:type IV secretory system conjugative DNA transfer family protein n=1 Tax=Bailinhaonella thermotolerans TaxID=1070861 RepID=UPI00192A2C40|nr:type IV secretory system conjugative DNA transfer family protein [Bailinhaonella thermotolerans]
MSIQAVAVLLAVAAAALAAAVVYLKKGRLWEAVAGRWRSRQDDITDLVAQSALSTADDLGAVAPGQPRPPYSIVCGYHIDQKSAARVRRDPGSGRLVVADPWTPLVVIGAPGSGKTTSIIEPAILEWDGPVLATSVKQDLASSTRLLRSRIGRVVVFDPSGQLPPALRAYRRLWTPLAACRTWKGACETAAAMVYASAAGGSSAGEDFWGTQASSLLAVMMYAVAYDPGTSMQDVSRLLGSLLQDTPADDALDPQDEDAGRGAAAFAGFAALERRLRDHQAALGAVWDTVVAASRAAGGELTEAQHEQLEAVSAAFDELEAALESLAPFMSYAQHAPQTIGGVVASITNVLQVYRFARDLAKITHDDPDLVDIDTFLHGKNTLYLVAPPKAQRLYAPLMTAFAEAVVSRAYEIAQARPDGRVPIPLLCALDEVANIAPLPELHSYAATARSYRIMLCLAAQDLSQLKARFGEERTYSILSCAGTAVVLPKTKDPMTLDWASKIAGEIRVKTTSKTVATSVSRTSGKSSAASSPSSHQHSKQSGESESVTVGHEWRPLASPARVAAMNEREGLAVVGAYRTQLLQRRAFEDARLQRLARGDVSALPDTSPAVASLPYAPEEELADLSGDGD